MSHKVWKFWIPTNLKQSKYCMVYVKRVLFSLLQCIARKQHVKPQGFFHVELMNDCFRDGWSVRTAVRLEQMFKILPKRSTYYEVGPYTSYKWPL